MVTITTGMIVSFVLGIILLGILIKVISIPLRWAWKFVVNSIVGALMLWVVSLFGVAVKINIISSFIAGVLGIPGVIIILLYTYM